MTDPMIEISAAVAHLSGALQSAGIHPRQWAVQLRDDDARFTLDALVAPHLIMPNENGLPPGVALRCGGIDFLEPRALTNRHVTRAG